MHQIIKYKKISALSWLWIFLKNLTFIVSENEDDLPTVLQSKWKRVIFFFKEYFNYVCNVIFAYLFVTLTKHLKKFPVVCLTHIIVLSISIPAKIYKVEGLREINFEFLPTQTHIKY